MFISCFVLSFCLFFLSVHRDIKPSNVLISCSNDGILRAILSDFGLCRRLPHNRHSYTVVSGIAGTEGWIAPELFSSVGKVVKIEFQLLFLFKM